MKAKLCWFVLIFFSLCFSFSCSNQKGYQPLNQNAKKNCTTEKSPYLFYSLPSNYFKSNNSLEITLCPESSTKETVVTVAFLYDTDFNGKTLIPSLPQRSVAQFILSNEFESTTISFAFLQEAASSIKGFLVHSLSPIKLTDAKPQKAKLGFLTTKNNNKTNLWYGFGINGGICAEIIPTSFDFSTYKVLCASSENAQFLVTFDQNIDFSSSDYLNQEIEISSNNKTIFVKRAENQSQLHLYPEVFNNSISKLFINQNPQYVSGVVCSFEPKQKTNAPIQADPGLIVDWPQNSWKNKDYIIFSWEQFPEILIFDTANYDIQDKLLKRLAFYTEKEGFKGRLAADSEIEDLHGFNAHDYRPETLAAFFDLAQKQKFPLNPYEVELCKILEEYKIIIKTKDGFEAGKGALISVSKEIPSYNRNHLLVHECMHGLYFVDSDFRDIVDLVYDIVDEKSYQFLKGYFISQPSLGYDVNDLYLMKNELMAYLLQQPISKIPNYFAENLANRGTVMKAMPDLVKYIKATNAQGLVDAALVLEGFLQTKWNFASGRISLVSVQ